MNPPTSDLNEPQRMEVAEMFLETLPSIMGFVSSELRRSSPVDNPVHFRLLRTLRRQGRSLHELAELHSVRLPTMSRTVSVLENRGWIQRTRSTEDRRTVYASITDKGRDVLTEVEQMAIARAAGLLARLSDEDVTSLRTGLRKLYEVIQEELGPDFEERHSAGNPADCHDDTFGSRDEPSGADTERHGSRDTS